jgi:hypothetical protein
MSRDPHPNALVQTADGLIKLLSEEEARFGQPAHNRPLPPVTLAPLAGEAVHTPKIVLRHAFNPLRW